MHFVAIRRLLAYEAADKYKKFPIDLLLCRLLSFFFAKSNEQ
jgi:hypothetical protein